MGQERLLRKKIYRKRDGVKSETGMEGGGGGLITRGVGGGHNISNPITVDPIVSLYGNKMKP